jgi:hypothetical protein
MPKKGKNNDKYASTPYTQIPDGLWVSKEFNELTAHARCIFMIAVSNWKPYEPGKPFALLYKDLREITGFQFNTISKAIKQLINDGFLDRPKRGCYPHNTALYTLKLEWIQKKYPKPKNSYPESIKSGG